MQERVVRPRARRVRHEVDSPLVPLHGAGLAGVTVRGKIARHDKRLVALAEHDIQPVVRERIRFRRLGSLRAIEGEGDRVPHSQFTAQHRVPQLEHGRILGPTPPPATGQTSTARARTCADPLAALKRPRIAWSKHLSSCQGRVTPSLHTFSRISFVVRHWSFAMWCSYYFFSPNPSTSRQYAQVCLHVELLLRLLQVRGCLAGRTPGRQFVFLAAFGERDEAGEFGGTAPREIGTNTPA